MRRHEYNYPVLGPSLSCFFWLVFDEKVDLRKICKTIFEFSKDGDFQDVYIIDLKKRWRMALKKQMPMQENVRKCANFSDFETLCKKFDFTVDTYRQLTIIIKYDSGVINQWFIKFLLKNSLFYMCIQAILKVWNFW